MQRFSGVTRVCFVVLIGVGLSASTGCQSSGSARKDSKTPTKSAAPAQSAKTGSTNKSAASAKHPTITAAHNPTTMAGRGAPDLDDKDRPAAWIYIDGHAGNFKDEGGHPLLQWFTDGSVSPTPTFRVEAYEPLLGTPKDFKAVLRTVETADGSEIVYGISAYDGTFEVGKDYSLLNPGEGFIVRNGQTGDTIKEISPLVPGTYALAAGVKNAATGKETLAVTYFTVAEK